MIIVAASMLKAGSSWFFNLINDLVIEAGHQDGREMRARFRLQNILSASDCTSKTLRIHRLAQISIPHWFGNTYTIKTAGKPTPAVKLAIDLGMMKAAFILRDPRDVTLSLFDHGEWIRRENVQMERVSSHIGISVPEEKLRAIIERYQISNRANWQQDLHFNVGKAGRWKERLSPGQQQKAMEFFGDYLARMGYES